LQFFQKAFGIQSISQLKPGTSQGHGAASPRKSNAENAAKDMERALFDYKPVLRNIWRDLSEQVRFDLFELHRPDLTSAYRAAVEASTPHYKPRPWPYRPKETDPPNRR
jgi:hypothetical protein